MGLNGLVDSEEMSFESVEYDDGSEQLPNDSISSPGAFAFDDG